MQESIAKIPHEIEPARARTFGKEEVEIDGITNIAKQNDGVPADEQTVQSALSTADLIQLRNDLASFVGRHRSEGVIVDVTALDVLASFATRTGTAMGAEVAVPGLGLVTLTAARRPTGMATVPVAVSVVSDTKAVVSAAPAK